MSDPVVGIVLRTTPVRESDLVVTLFTNEHGRLGAVARGGRKSQKRFAGALQPLVLARYQLGRKPRGDLWTLEGADILREWTALASDLVAHAHASYVAELLDAVLPAEQPEPEALALATGLFDSLAQAGPSPAALRAVELGLLELAGHLPALDRCAACGATDLDAGGAVFDPVRGGALCRRCAATSRGPGVRPLEPGALAYLRQIAATPHDVDAARTADADHAAADRTAGRDALVAMVVSVVGRPLRSLEYLGKLMAVSSKR